MQPTVQVITPLTRGLPKTTQIISYRIGDDGDYEAGWWLGLKAANNRQRFVGCICEGEWTVIDKATGLTWAANGSQAGCNNGNVIAWAEAIDYALALSFAGFNDWRLPNIKELQSIIDYSRSFPCIYPELSAAANSTAHWTSTTYKTTTTNAWLVYFDNGVCHVTLKLNARHIRCVRGAKCKLTL